MPRWKKDEREFVVSVRDGGDAGFVCHIPKPLVEELKIDGRIKFSKVGKRIEVSKPK